MKTPEEMYYEWRQAFDENLFERMCKGEPIELQLLHQELGKETFLAGYQAAKDNQEYLMNEMSILRSRLDTAEKLSQLVDEEKEQ